jgi:hypothetical protein
MLGKQFPAALAAAGLRVERHDDHFGERTADEEWLEAVGRNGWVAITRDTRIRYKPNQLKAVVDHRAAVIVLIGKATFPDLAVSLIATSERIERFAAAITPPYIAKLYRASSDLLVRNPAHPGRIERWYP